MVHCFENNTYESLIMIQIEHDTLVMFFLKSKIADAFVFPNKSTFRTLYRSWPRLIEMVLTIKQLC